MAQDLSSLLVIAGIAAASPLIIGLTRIRVPDVVLLIAGGVIFGPSVLGWITVDRPIALLAELGLAMLFLLAGMEISSSTMRGRAGRLGAISWFASMGLAAVLALTLAYFDVIADGLGVMVALTSTAFGTLLPIMRDSGLLDTKFGRLFLPAGAWGELGPIIAISILLGTKSTWLGLLTLVAFIVIALVVALVPSRMKSKRLAAIIARGEHTSSQTSIRLIVLLVVLLLTVASRFQLDTVLGAFAAGLILRRLTPEDDAERLLPKIEAIAFGVLTPVFFVVSGAKLDLGAILTAPQLLALFFVLIVIVRALPALVLYRREIPDLRERFGFSLYLAVGLPMIVAVTTLQLEAGIMRPATAAALVGAGVVTVIVLPLLAAALTRRAAEGVQS